jgi:hypothetical protein
MSTIFLEINKDNTLVPLHWSDNVQTCETKKAEYIILRVNAGSDFMQTLEDMRLEANLEDVTSLVLDLAQEKLSEISFFKDARHEFFENYGYLEE